MLCFCKEDDRPLEHAASTFHRTFTKSDHFKVGCAVCILLQDNLLTPAQVRFQCYLFKLVTVLLSHMGVYFIYPSGWLDFPYYVISTEMKRTGQTRSFLFSLKHLNLVRISARNNFWSTCYVPRRQTEM